MFLNWSYSVSSLCGSSEENHLPTTLPTTYHTSEKWRHWWRHSNVLCSWWRHMPIFVTMASRQKQIMTSQNRRARPFYKPPASLQLTSSTRYTPYRTCIANFLSGAAQPFKMQRNTEREYNCNKELVLRCLSWKQTWTAQNTSLFPHNKVTENKISMTFKQWLGSKEYCL